MFFFFSQSLVFINITEYTFFFQIKIGVQSLTLRTLVNMGQGVPMDTLQCGATDIYTILNFSPLAVPFIHYVDHKNDEGDWRFTAGLK